MAFTTAMAVTTAFHYTFQITEFLLLSANSGPRFSNLFPILKNAKILEKENIQNKSSTFKEPTGKLFEIFHISIWVQGVLGNDQRVQWMETWPANSSRDCKIQSLI